MPLGIISSKCAKLKFGCKSNLWMLYLLYNGEVDIGRSLSRETVTLNLSRFNEDTSCIRLVASFSFSPWCP